MIKKCTDCVKWSSVDGCSKKIKDHWIGDIPIYYGGGVGKIRNIERDYDLSYANRCQWFDKRKD